MTVYEQKLNVVRDTVYSNQKHINTAMRIRTYIEKNYDRDLRLKILSSEHFVSKFHLIRLFKRYYGLTPRQYLIDIRIKKAKDNLNKGLSVTECCYAVGFKSLGSFSTLFKQKTSKSPIDYRKEQFSRKSIVLKS